VSKLHHIHLVGSMNLPSAVEAMTAASDILGNGLLRLPDGEPGPRRGWIYYQRPMFTHNRFLDAPDEYKANQALQASAPRIVRKGVRPEDIEFPELGYAREARTSFLWFKDAKAAGRIPKHLRFQVSLPTPYACLLTTILPEALVDVEPAYEAAMFREVAQICADIPHSELAIQWDICLEMVLFDGRSNLPWQFDLAEHSERLRRLTGAIPDTVHHGVHLCYGDYDGRHVIQPEDATKLTEFANLVTRLSPRPLQWIHMPVPIDRTDEAYFAPFANLSLHAETEVFLGLIHHSDGVTGAEARIRSAEKFLPTFGISTECGVGRMHTTGEIRELFNIHKEASGYTG
jgi:hypothetical protein